MSSTLSQFSCFSSIQNRFHLANRSRPNLVRLQATLQMLLLQLQTAIYCSGSKSALKYATKASKSDNDLLEKPSSNVEEYDAGEPTQHVDSEPKRAAKIHDFCFGIPYGGIVLGGGLVGFLFTRNLSSLMSGGLYGGALLALSVFSLKVWGQGHSSVPFILGQAGIAAALLWNNMQTYSLTKKLLPTAFNIFISGAMLCFYAYVVLSGGNPPPKKLKSAAAAAPS
ncbi:putative TMEM14 family protein [Helianthus anomalus]